MADREECSLNADQLQQRQALARQTVLAKVNHVERREQILTIELDQDPATESAVQDFIFLEQQCCGFLTFDLTCIEENESMLLTITGTAGAEDILNMFESAARSTNP